MEITRDLFELQRHRRFGRANPEVMNLPVWTWMVHQGLNPYQAIERFGAGLDTGNGPDWCFARRYGMSSTSLPSGETVFVGGEYEDWNDPEFCVYNDVVVRRPDGEIDIFGYPRHEFRPTDFHTASAVDGRIILIGCLGYERDRVPGFTPVLALNTLTYQIERVEAEGESPGWIFGHSAHIDPGRSVIAVAGGKAVVDPNALGQFRRNVDDFELDLRHLRWHRLTQRNWPQFRIAFYRADGSRSPPAPGFDLVQCLRKIAPYEIIHGRPPEAGGPYRIRVDGVPITFWDDPWDVTVVVEGRLPESVVSAVLDEAMKNTLARARLQFRLEIA
jgi:hypothetical protein